MANNPGVIQVEGGVGNIHIGADANIPGNIFGGGIHYHAATELKPEELDAISHQLKALLQPRYKNIRIPTLPWLDDWHLPLKDYFVELTMTHKCNTKTQGQPKSVLLQNIFLKKESVTPTRMLIEGPAGYGKTTLAHKLCYDYGNNLEYVKQFQQVILIHLRDFDGTLDQMILKTLKYEDHRPEDVLGLLQKKQKEIMYILDGLDELPQSKHQYIIPLLKREKYPQSTVIVTSRLGNIPIDSKDLAFPDVLQCYDRRIEIKGVTGNGRLQFMSTYLSKYPEDKIKQVKELLKDKFGFQFNDEPMFSNLFLKVRRFFFPLPPNDDLFDSPLFLLLLFTLVLNTDIQQINGRSDLYKLLFNFVVRRSLAKTTGSNEQIDLFDFDQVNPPPYVSTIVQFGEMALEALAKNQFNISQEITKKHFGNDETFLLFGFLTQNSNIEGVTQRVWFEPVHLSLLEFAVAYYLFSKPARQLVTQLCIKFPFLHERSLVLSFYEGLVKEHLSGKNELTQTSDIDLITLVSLDYTVSDYPLFSLYLLNTAQQWDINGKVAIFAFLSLCASGTASKKADEAVNPILQLGRLAIEILKSDNDVISKESLQSVGCDDVATILEFGFLKEESSENYKPADQSLLEFAAACHFTDTNMYPSSDLPENVQNFFELLNKN